VARYSTIELPVSISSDPASISLGLYSLLYLVSTST
jgi:hypothetical protein